MRTRLSRRTRGPVRSLRRSRTRRVIRRLTISISLALILATSIPAYVPVSTAYAADSVTVSVVELEGMIASVDTLLLERRLLQIDLTEARHIAKADSLMYEERLDIYRARERSWLTKALSHPAIWFMVGAYAGLRATK